MADTLKNLRRQADMGIRKVKGSAGGIGDEVGVTGLPDQLSRYEHLIGIVQSISKDMRLIVSGQLSLAQQGHDLEMKVRQIGQVLNLAGPETVTVIDVEVRMLRPS